MQEYKSVRVELSEAKKAQLKQWQAQIKEELPELAKRLQLATEAAKENTFSGELRRAIHASGLTLITIADRVGSTPIILDEFLTGERTLRSDTIDRIAALLGCELRAKSTNTQPANISKTA
jgi:hypothetical protein